MQTIKIVCKHDVIICSIQEKPNVINLNFLHQRLQIKSNKILLLKLQKI
jgi:hypothetical protein